MPDNGSGARHLAREEQAVDEERQRIRVVLIQPERLLEELHGAYHVRFRIRDPAVDDQRFCVPGIDGAGAGRPGARLGNGVRCQGYARLPIVEEHSTHRGADGGVLPANFQRPLEEPARLLQPVRVPAKRRLAREGEATPGGDIAGGMAMQGQALVGSQLNLEGFNDLSRDTLLNIEHIVDRTGEALRPDVGIARPVHETNAHAQALAVAEDTAFEEPFDPQGLGDRRGRPLLCDDG